MFVGRIASYEEYGRVVNGGLLGGAALGHWRQWDFEPYFQDDWRVTSKLTLNLGVRYYWLTPFRDATDLYDSIFIPSQYTERTRHNSFPAAISFRELARTISTTETALRNVALESSGRLLSFSTAARFRRDSVSLGFSFGTGKMVLWGGYALNWESSNPLQGGAGFNGNRRRPPHLLRI